MGWACRASNRSARQSLSIRATSRLADGPERFSGRVAFAAEMRRITPEPIIRPAPKFAALIFHALLSCLDPTEVAALACERCFGAADMGIIMVRFVRLRFAAVAMIAAAIIAATTASGWAFRQQMISPDANGNYNFNYPDRNFRPPPPRAHIRPSRIVRGSTSALNMARRGRSAVSRAAITFLAIAKMTGPRS